MYLNIYVLFAVENLPNEYSIKNYAFFHENLNTIFCFIIIFMKWIYSSNGMVWMTGWLAVEATFAIISMNVSCCTQIRKGYT